MALNILFLCNKPKDAADANTIIDHISAFEKYSQHNMMICSNLGDLPGKLDLTRFDAIVIHYSLTLINEYYISAPAKKRLRDFQGLKILFIQDEYRQIFKIITEIQYLAIDVLFTCFPPEEMGKIYDKKALPLLSRYSNLTGYIPERLLNRSAPAIAQRAIDVGYRSRKVPFWLGQLGFEKWDIVEQWKHHVTKKELVVNISYAEEDRIYGDKWVEFLTSCKTTLGVESGASVMDFTGQLQTTVDQHVLAHRKATFQEVQRLYLTPYENQYKLNQISPRSFETIALKTALVLYEGEYSGILVPHRHYIPLKKDFSNIKKVLASIKDTTFLQQMTDIAYEEIALNTEYTYRHFINTVDQVINEEFRVRQKKRASLSYTHKELHALFVPAKKVSAISTSIRTRIKTRIRTRTSASTTNTCTSSSDKNAIPIPPIYVQVLALIIRKTNNTFLWGKIEYFFTHKIVVFNPLCHKIKKKLLQTIQGCPANLILFDRTARNITEQ